MEMNLGFKGYLSGRRVQTLYLNKRLFYNASSENEKSLCDIHDIMFSEAGGLFESI